MCRHGNNSVTCHDSCGTMLEVCLWRWFACQVRPISQFRHGSGLLTSRPQKILRLRLSNVIVIRGTRMCGSSDNGQNENMSARRRHYYLFASARRNEKRDSLLLHRRESCRRVYLKIHLDRDRGCVCARKHFLLLHHLGVESLFASCGNP